MADDFLGDRKKALEESFFAKENAALLERLKVEEWAQATKAKLAEISGIQDDEVLTVGASYWAKLVEQNLPAR